MPHPIRTAEQRERLDVRDKPYFERVTDKLHLGYRKGKLKRSWVIRWRQDGAYHTETVMGLVPDDLGNETHLPSIGFDQMEKRIMKDKELTCSFCGKGANEIEKLVAGPGVYICNRCHEIAGYYMDNPNQTGRVKMDSDGRAELDKDGAPIFE